MGWEAVGVYVWKVPDDEGQLDDPFKIGCPGTSTSCAIDWIISDDGQALISSFFSEQGPDECLIYHFIGDEWLVKTCFELGDSSSVQTIQASSDLTVVAILAHARNAETVHVFRKLCAQAVDRWECGNVEELGQICNLSISSGGHHIVIARNSTE